MTRQRGYLLVTDPDAPRGVSREQDVAVCAHCQAVVPLPTRAQAASHPTGWCGRCSAVICTACARGGVCAPFEKRLRQLEARDALRRAAGV